MRTFELLKNWDNGITSSRLFARTELNNACEVYGSNLLVRRGLKEEFSVSCDSRARIILDFYTGKESGLSQPDSKQEPRSTL